MHSVPSSTLHDRTFTVSLQIRSFLKATSPIPDVPDYDYDFDMREFGSQKNYLISELTCAEKTLSKRRSELAEIEDHIAQCKADFIDAQNEVWSILASKMLFMYAFGYRSSTF